MVMFANLLFFAAALGIFFQLLSISVMKKLLEKYKAKVQNVSFKDLPSQLKMSLATGVLLLFTVVFLGLAWHELSVSGELTLEFKDEIFKFSMAFLMIALYQFHSYRHYCFVIAMVQLPRNTGQ